MKRLALPSIAVLFAIGCFVLLMTSRVPEADLAPEGARTESIASDLAGPAGAVSQERVESYRDVHEGDSPRIPARTGWSDTPPATAW